MIYTTDIIGYQWEVFIKAVLLGLILGGCFAVFRMAGIIFRFGKKFYFAADFLFCVWCGFIIFSFLLNENFGMPRFYIYFGIGAGFSAVYFTLRKITAAAAEIIRKIMKAFLKPFGKISRKIAEKFKIRSNKAKIFIAGAGNKGKSLLKKRAGLVYNILCLNVSKAFSFCGGKAGKEPKKVENNGTEKTEKGSFPQNRGCCLRGISSVFTDLDAGEYKRKTERT